VCIHQIESAVQVVDVYLRAIVKNKEIVARKVKCFRVAGWLLSLMVVLIVVTVATLVWSNAKQALP
jgi:hypothetical protein